jgi:4-hydroxy-tetrahydrodipicolinate synthase
VATYDKTEAKEYAKETLEGVFTAFCLPETEPGEIDEAGLRHDVRHYIDVIGARGLYVHGFYGNYWLLTSEERRRALEIVVDENAGALPIVCRCAHQTPKETIALMQHAEQLGVDFISLIGPPFASASPKTVRDYFEYVASHTNLGISIFNTRQAGYVISPELMAELADIPNVCALKNDVDMTHTIQIRNLVGERIVVIDPSEETFLLSLTQFGQRAIYTGTNYMFDTAHATPMRDYVEAALAGDHARAAELYFAMQPLRDLHHRWVIEPWKATGVCPISTIKHWTERNGLTGGAVRPPLQELPVDDKARFLEELDAAATAPRTAVV